MEDLQSENIIVQYGIMALMSHVKNKTHERLVHQDQIKNFFLKKNRANTKTMEKSQNIPLDSCENVLPN